MTPEARLLKRVMNYSRSMGGIPLRLSFQRGVSVGFPDLLILLSNGRALFMECKRLGGKPTPLQLHRIKQLRELGFTAEWCDNFDAARAIIASALDSARVPSPRSGASAHPPIGGAGAGSRPRKDGSDAARVLRSESSRPSEDHAGDRTTARLQASLAAGRVEMDGVQTSPFQPFTRFQKRTTA